LGKEAKIFLESHDVAVLSTQNKWGGLFGAPVYYIVQPKEKVYILTRSETAKAKNILSNPGVALTVFDADPARTLQIQGLAKIETDQTTKTEVFNELTKKRPYTNGLQYPPVTHLNKGSYMVILIIPTSAIYRPYQL
jgi:general stress protein 26